MRFPIDIAVCRRFIQDELAAVRVFEDEPYNMPSEVTKA